MAPDPPAAARFEVMTDRPGAGGLDAAGPAHAEAGRTGGGPGPAFVLLAVAAVLAVSILKPWDAGAAGRDGGRDPGAVARPAPTGAVTSPSAVPPAGPGPAGDGSSPGRPVTPGDRTPRAPAVLEPTVLPAIPDPAALSEVLVPRDEWGLRAIVFEPATGTSQAGMDARLVERWIRADVEGSSRSINAPAAFAGDAVIAFGLTVPAGVRPIAVRIWRLSDLELPQRVVVEEVTGPGPLGVLWQPGRAATALGTWPRGSYRFDILLEDRVVRMFSAVPTGARSAVRFAPLAMGPRPDLVTEVLGMSGGLYAVSGPDVVRVAAEPGLPLGEHDAWLAGPCSAPAGPCPVGLLVSRTTSAVGLVLEPGDTPVGAAFRLIAPVPRSPRMVAEVLATGPVGGLDTRPVVVLRVDSPGPLSSGLYRLTVAWITRDGAERTADWHFEIVPPGLEPSGILAP